MNQETTPGSELHCEPNRFSVRAIIIAGIGLAVITATGMALMAWMYASLASNVAPPEPLSESILAVQPAPIEPSLDPYLRKHLQEMRQAEGKLLHSYAWLDPATGIARVPIERAIEILLAKSTGTAGAAGAPSPAAETQPVEPVELSPAKTPAAAAPAAEVPATPAAPEVPGSGSDSSSSSSPLESASAAGRSLSSFSAVVLMADSVPGNAGRVAITTEEAGS